MLRLSFSTLCRLPAHVPRPNYDRTRLQAGIVHFGVGGFHRSHQAMYLDRIMSLEGERARQWGICGVGVMPGDQAMRAALQPQDGLYTLLVKHPDGRCDARIIGSIIECLYAPDDPARVVALLAAPSVKIVSLTITEGGYNFQHDSGEFNFNEPAVVGDLQAGGGPRTVFGLVTEALRLRRERGIAPFTVLSCDNLQANGERARETFLAFAGRKNPGLKSWIEREVSFPNCMVDRITPVTTEADRKLVRSRCALADAWPVACEDFSQWVIEDHFVAGRPELEQVGAQFVSEVAPYELMKLRLLNGSHQALAYLGYLCGYRYVHEAARDPAMVDFLLDYMKDEVTPTLPPVPGIELAAYQRMLLDRFGNRAIADSLARICANTSERIPKWVLPVVQEQLRLGGPMARAAAVVASWARYAGGIDELGRPIEVVDRMKDDFAKLAANQRSFPVEFIKQRAVFGALGDEPRFVQAYLEAFEFLRAHGARATLEHYR